MTKDNKKKLTKRTVDSLTPQEKRYIVWDTLISGFGVRVQPSGTKTFFIQYRNANRESKWFVLGQMGHLTPEIARDMASSTFARIKADNYDPSEAKKLKIKELTVSELCDLYLEKGCKHKKKSTLESDKGRIKWHIKPLLGKKKITSLRRADVERMKHDIAEGKTKTVQKAKKHGVSKVSGGQGTANRTVTLLSTIYTFAIGSDLVEINPCKGIKKYKEEAKERFLSPQEFKELGNALRQADNEEHVSPLNMIRMLILTGCRKSEIQTLKWEYINREEPSINLPDSKTGKKKVQLSQAAFEILEKQPRQKDNPYVFHGLKHGHYFVGLQKVWNRVKAKHPSLADVRLHDLRHSYASVGVTGGYTLQMIGALLGHSNPATTARYAHLSDDPKKLANEDIADRISEYLK